MDKKFCVHCGAEVHPQAVVCIHCGCSVDGGPVKTARTTSSSADSSEIMKTLIKVFMIIGTVSAASFFLIPLIWCIPMFLKVNRYLKGEEELSVGFKICVLLFVNIIAGVLLLVDEK